jgi:hypothetical protein
MGFDPVKRVLTLIDEIIEFQKIAGGISADRQFRKNDQRGPTLLGHYHRIDDLAGVACKIAYVIVLLRNGDLHLTKVRHCFVAYL